MAGWLSSAARVFGGAAQPAPQPFDIRCACGGKVTGFRDDEARLLPCPGCRQTILVLPATPYPIPKRAAPPPPRPRPTSDEGDVADGGAASPTSSSSSQSVERPLKKSLRKRGSQRTDSAVPGPNDPATADPASSETGPTGAVPAGNKGSNSASRTMNPLTGEPPQSRRQARQAAMDASWTATRRWLGRVFTPVRLVALVVIALVSVTGLALRQREINRILEQTVTESTKRGELAFKERDWRGAAEAYRATAVALDRLGRDDPPARRLRQWDRELSAVTNPLPRSLPDLVSEAAGDHLVVSELDWPTLFLASYGDAWLVMEVWVEPGVDGGPPRVEIPFLAGRYRASLVGEVPRAAVIPSDRLPARVLLATRLSAIEKRPVEAGEPEEIVAAVNPGESGPAVVAPVGTVPEAEPAAPVQRAVDAVWPGHDGEWLVRLDSESAFLWARSETLNETGLLLSDDDLAAAELLLKDQAKWLGVVE